MTFKEAFKQARAQGLQEFTWGKGRYNTKMRTGTNSDGTPKVETDEEWSAALQKNKPQASGTGITYVMGRKQLDANGNPTGEFTPLKDNATTTDINVARNYMLSKNEPVVDQANPFEPGNFNTSMTFNRGNVRANRGTNYSNVDQLWDYIGTHGESTEAQLFNNVLGGLEGDNKKKAFMDMMAKYKVSGNLGRRDSGRLANLFNDLNAIGTEGSEARQGYVDSFNKSFAQAQKPAAETVAALQRDPNTQRQMAMQSIMVGNAGASTLGDAGAGTMNNQKQLKYADK